MKFKPVLVEDQNLLQIKTGQLVVDLKTKQIYIDKDDSTRVPLDLGDKIYTKDEINNLISWTIEE